MIDLSRLPAPDIVETIDYEAILGEMLADLRNRDSEFDALVESDPAYKILEVAAYREVILRQRVNDAAKAVMLAYASGADLDQIGAGVDVVRVDGESDDRYRSRVQMSWERLSTAGPAKSYRYWGFSVGNAVKDIGVYSPTPGCVRVVVLGADGDGVPSPDLLAEVDEAVSSDERRPLTDTVETVAVQIVRYNVTASLELYPGVAAEPVIEEAQSKVQAVVDDLHLIDEDIMLSRVVSALHVGGVKSVDLVSPSEDLLIDCSQAGYCSGISLTWRVADRR